MVFPHILQVLDEHSLLTLLTVPSPLADKTVRRANAFTSREAAREYLITRPFYSSWEHRVLDAFVNCGLKEVQQDDGSPLFRLKCDPAHEAENFRVGT